MSSRIEPGYCIATLPGPLFEQAKVLFRRRNTDAARLFMKLNADTPYVLPGHMMIVATPANSNQTSQLQHLQRAKLKVNESMKFMHGDTALFLAKHHDQIDKILNLSSKGFEYTTEFGKKYFQQIGGVLHKIEKLYQYEFSRSGKINGQQFYTQRAALFAELKALISRPVLNKIVPTTIKMRPYLKMTQALGLSTSSIIHQWTTAGAVGAIKGYAERLEASAKAAKFFKRGGYITLALGVMMTTNDVVQACAIGRENECRKAALINYMGLGGSTLAGSYLASKGAIGGELACVAAGITTGGMGLAICAAGGAIAGGVAGAYIGDKIGKSVGEGIDFLSGKILIE